MIEHQIANMMPRIGDEAPDFTAETTEGMLDFYDWQGDSWVVFFSHPADFTPVCSTELAEFARRRAEFDQRNVKLLGVSVDSIHSHLAWRENLAEILDTQLNFPLIADLDTRVSRMYGMLHPNESTTVTVRALFAIDPNHLVRALIYYPLNVGRSVDEVVRLVDALQTTDENTVACPVNWKPGDKVIVPPPRSVSDIEERASHSEYERVDFYLNRVELR
jgi:peroxiredoxin (alkyl hydroperoxide reductase subunit C)